MDTLTKAVLKQLGGGADARESARDAAKHGADAGWPGFTYCVDTAAFARAHKRAMVAALQDDASNFGQTTVDMLGAFGCYRRLNMTPVEVDALWAAYLTGTTLNGPLGDLEASFLDGLAWYALERAGHALESAVAS